MLQTMKSFAAAVGIAVIASGSAYGYADHFPWKLLWGGVDTGATLHIAGVYTTEQACRAEGQALSRERSPKGCNYGACHFYTYCVELSGNPW
jgi:hypothetical protein